MMKAKMCLLNCRELKTENKQKNNNRNFFFSLLSFALLYRIGTFSPQFIFHLIKTSALYDKKESRT